MAVRQDKNAPIVAHYAVFAARVSRQPGMSSGIDVLRYDVLADTESRTARLLRISLGAPGWCDGCGGQRAVRAGVAHRNLDLVARDEPLFDQQSLNRVQPAFIIA